MLAVGNKYINYERGKLLYCSVFFMKKKLIEQIEYGKNNKLNAAYTYSYELDRKGNWTRQKKIQNGSVIEIKKRERFPITNLT